MTKLQKAKNNPFLTVREDYWKCPKCGNKLFNVHESLPTTMDGNTIYYCESNDLHVFWSNPRGPENTLRLNENATDSDFSFSEEYFLENKNWIKI